MAYLTKSLFCASAIVNLVCSMALGAELDVSVTSGGGDVVIAVPCGASIPYEVRGILSDTANEGLAGFLLDLELTGGSLEPLDTPVAEPIVSFACPLGINGPHGFGGVVVGNRLVNVGGAQNTLNIALGSTSCLTGPVVTGVGHTETVLATGTLTPPPTPGTYVLKVASLTAAVIREGETGFPFWATEPAGTGTIGNLTIEVLSPDPPANASNDGPICEGDPVTLFGQPDGMVSYEWTGPGGFASTEQNAIVSPATPGTYTLTVIDTNNCVNTAGTDVTVIPDACEPWADCNSNSVHDECDVAVGASPDCNTNGIPDECERDADADGLLDDCDNCPNHPNLDQADCDGDGVGDVCTIATCTGEPTCMDCNGNTVPDECQPGDVDGNKAVDWLDHAGFIHCITGPCGDAPCDPLLDIDSCCPIVDFDGNGTVDLKDAAAFQRIFTGP